MNPAIIVDNNPSLKGSVWEADGFTATIIPGEEIINYDTGEYIILICMPRNQIESVEKQVKEYHLEIPCYSYQLAMNAIAKIVYKARGEKWEVDYKMQVKEWLKHIKSEYDWHNISLSSFVGNEYKGLTTIARLEMYDIKEGDVIMDVGCGPMLKYQNIINGVNVKMIPVDPLAHLYNHILEKYNIKITNSINFALGEHLSMFFEKESANYILFDNSLDHTINPVRCLLEAYKLLKKGGVISLYHCAVESMFNWHNDLHQWDFYEYEGDFYIANVNAKINIKHLFGKSAKIEVYEEYWDAYKAQAVVVNIVKEKDVDFEVVDKYDCNLDNGHLISALYESVINVENFGR